MSGRKEARLLLSSVGALAGTTTLALEPGQDGAGADPLALRYRIQHPVRVSELHFSPDGRVLVASAVGISYLRDVYLHSHFWEAATGKPLAWMSTPSPHAEDTVLAFSLDGKRIVTRGEDHVVRIREVASGEELLQLRPSPSGEVGVPVKVAAFSRDGQRLTTVAMGGGDGEVRVWNAASGGVLKSFVLPRTTLAVYFSPDARYLLARESEKLLVWGVDSGKQLTELPLRSVMWNLAFSPDGTRVAFCVGHHSDSDFTTEVWNVRAGKRLAELPVSSPVTPVFSPNGQRLLTRGMKAQLWDWKSGEQLVAFDHTDLAAAAFSPDGTHVATAGRVDHVVRLWEVPGGRELPQVRLPDNNLAAVAFSPDGRLLATLGDDMETRVWAAPMERAQAGDAPARMRNRRQRKSPATP
ncbi:WD40 repeat domain-containing protein [Archangium violaceum]|uniref:WD40 repeat domain-containing protein n=1 Tax=Archangium violaceum TaxID=83451 RepID=UPI0036D86F8B